MRDSGILHALLGLRDEDALLAHPVLGASWEGFVIESLLSIGGDNVTGHYYRTSGGAEIDLLLHFSDGRLWAVEIKRTPSPKPNRGFHSACNDLNPERKLIAYPGDETFPLGNGVEAVPVFELAKMLQGSVNI